MKKIIFGITSLNIGGAEKVLIDIVNELSNEYNITIFTLYGNGELEKKIPANVKHITMYKKSYNEFSKLAKIGISLKLLFLKKLIYNKYIKQDYETEISFLEGPITNLFSVKNTNTKKVAWVHTDISKIFGNGIKAKIKKYINQKIYKQYDKIILVSKDSLEKFKTENPNISDNKLMVLHNYINKDRVIKEACQPINNFPKDTINFVTVARLVQAKAIDRLINIHSKLIQAGFKHNFYVIGNGELKEK